MRSIIGSYLMIEGLSVALVAGSCSGGIRLLPWSTGLEKLGLGGECPQGFACPPFLISSKFYSGPPYRCLLKLPFHLRVCWPIFR